MPQNVGGPLAATLDMMLLGVQAGLAFTKDIHRHGLFMQKRCQFKLWKACSSFLRAYAVLAEKSLQDGQSLFGLVPKFHAMAHFKADVMICWCR